MLTLYLRLHCCQCGGLSYLQACKMQGLSFTSASIDPSDVRALHAWRPALKAAVLMHATVLGAAVGLCLLRQQAGGRLTGGPWLLKHARSEGTQKWCQQRRHVCELLQGLRTLQRVNAEYKVCVRTNVLSRVAASGGVRAGSPACCRWSVADVAHLKHDESRAAATFNAGLHIGALLLANTMGATNAGTIDVWM